MQRQRPLAFLRGLVPALPGLALLAVLAAVGPDGTRLVTAGQDGTVRVWDADTGREVGFYAGHAERVSAVAYSPDGKTVASGGADPEIKIWDPATGKDVKSLKGHTEFLTGL